MDRNSIFKKLVNSGIHTHDQYRDMAFSRNIGLLTQEEQDLLANVRVGIPGMGGVGGLHFITLVRTGIGKFHISDFDKFEAANVNRQYGARIPDFGHSKLEAMKREALSINPYLDIKAFNEGLTEDNLDDFLEGVDVVLDSLDYFEFEIRRKLFNRAQEKGTYVITAGPLGFSAAMLIFSPHEGMTFDEYFNISDRMEPVDKYISFGIGLAPKTTHFQYVDFSKVDVDKQCGPSLNIACQLCSAMAATQALKIVLKRGRVKSVPHYIQFDPYVGKLHTGKLFRGNRHPIQKMKISIAKKLVENRRKQHHTEIPELPKAKPSKDTIPEEVIRYLIKAGIQAPSGDNAQPWKFSYTGNAVNLYIDRNADTSFFNVNQTASFISCGAVIENIKIAAKSLYLDTETDILPDRNNHDLIATIRLLHAESSDSVLADHIFSRQTNRKLFGKKPVSPVLLKELEAAVEPFSGVKLHCVTGKESLKKLGDLIFDIDRIRSEHRPLHEHLHKMIRYTPEDAENKKDGLPLKNLEAGLPGEAILKITRPWPVMNIANKAGLGKMIAHISRQGILKSGGAALLTVSGTLPEDFIKGGRALENIWLTLTRKGLFVQPMTAITLFWTRWQMEGGKNFIDAHKERLPAIWDAYQALFPDVTFSKDGHIMLFRMGYGKGVRCNTYRKEIDALIRKNA
ncbi:MAG: ThiF family adenylyltransferase [Proteobacteria bacterium]|nr:ThiF family adenylyltransferase [Pseudomonadota bacterium]